MKYFLFFYQNSFSITSSGKYAIKLLLNIPSHLKRVAVLSIKVRKPVEVTKRRYFCKKWNLTNKQTKSLEFFEIAFDVQEVHILPALQL